MWTAVKVIYFPVYFTAYVLHKAARLLLALSYFLMFDFRMGWDVVKGLFGPNLPDIDDE